MHHTTLTETSAPTREPFTPPCLELCEARAKAITPELPRWDDLGIDTIQRIRLVASFMAATGDFDPTEDVIKNLIATSEMILLLAKSVHEAIAYQGAVIPVQYAKGDPVLTVSVIDAGFHLGMPHINEARRIYQADRMMVAALGESA